MDRYQFEDLISDYLDNSLSLDSRREFESYLDSDPDARHLVESMADMLDTLHRQPPVRVSAGFNQRLLSRINRLDSPVYTEPPKTRTIMGFRPQYAVLMTGLALAFVLVGYELLPTPGTPTSAPLPFAAQSAPATNLPQNRPAVSPGNPTVYPAQGFASTEDDSAQTNSPAVPNRPDYSKQIQLVKNPR
ncbi:MAG: hypothetical protein D6762_02130 [Candidatus Neomarinimicrobiota bacterium]|nr:MAG: hypothetical protein D6762_02130 [Candidatus Neomarinimicrobiota bacterium]